MMSESFAAEDAKEFRQKGVKYSKKNEFENALQCFEKAKSIYENFNDYKEVIICLNLIGNLYRDSKSEEDWEKAVEIYNKSIEIAKKIDAKRELAISLNNLALLYRNLNEKDKALKTLKKSLILSKELEDIEKISISLNGIADLYRDKEVWDKALEYYKTNLKISSDEGEKILHFCRINLNAENELKDFEDNSTYFSTISGLYRLLRKRKKYTKLSQYHEVNLNSAKELSFNEWDNLLETLNTLRKAKKAELISLSKIGNLYATLEDWDNAIDFYTKGLDVAKFLENWREELIFNSLIHSLYKNKWDLDNSFIYYKNCMEIASSFEDEIGFLISLSLTCDLRRNKGKWQETTDEYYQRIDVIQESKNSFKVIPQNKLDLGQQLEYYKKIADVNRELGSEKKRIKALKKVGYLYKEKRDLNEAIKIFKISLKIAKKINDEGEELESLIRLADIYKEIGQYDKALSIYEMSTKIEKENLNKVKLSNNNESQIHYLYCLVTSLQAQGDLYKDQRAIECYKNRDIFLEDLERKVADYVGTLISRNQGNTHCALESLENLAKYYESHQEWGKAIEKCECILNNLDKFSNYIEDDLYICRQIIKLANQHGYKSKALIASNRRIGDFYRNSGRYEEALEYYERSLDCATELVDNKGIFLSLKRIGNLYQQKKEFEKSRRIYDNWFKIANEINLKQEIFDSSKALGNLCKQQKATEEAIFFYEKCLETALAIEKSTSLTKDVDETKLGREDALRKILYSSNELANLHRILKKWGKEYKYRMLSLKVSQDNDLNDKKGVIKSSKRIALYLKNKNFFDKAFKYYNLCYITSLSIGDSSGILNSLKWMGDLYKEEMPEKALVYYGRLSKTAKKIGDLLEDQNIEKKEFKKRELLSLIAIGDVYRSQRKWIKALSYYEKSLKIENEIKTKYKFEDKISGLEDEISISLKKIGDIYRLKGNRAEALSYYEESLKISRELGYESRIIDVMNCIGNLHFYENDWQRALTFFTDENENIEFPISLKNLSLTWKENFKDDLEYYNAYLEFARDIGNKIEIFNCLYAIGDIYQEKGDLIHSKEVYIECCKISEDLEDESRKSEILSKLLSLQNLQGNKKNVTNYHRNITEEGFKNQGGVVNKNPFPELRVLFSNEKNVLSLLEKLEAECKLNKDNPVIYGIIGNLYRYKKKWRESIKFYEKCLRNNKCLENKELRTICLDKEGKSYLNMGDLDSALNCFEELMDILKPCQDCEDIEKLFCYQKIIGKIYQNKGEWNKALEKYQKMLKISREFNCKGQTFDSLKLIGKLYRYNGKWREAITFFDDLIKGSDQKLKEYNKNDYHYLLLKLEVSISQNILGNLYKDLGIWDKASICYEKCLHTSEELKYKESFLSEFFDLVSTTYNDLGYLLQDKGEWADAKKHYLKCLELSNKARKYHLSSLKTANDVKTTNYDEQVSIALNNLGRLHQNTGEWSQALDYFKASRNGSEAVRYEEGLSITYDNLGNLYRNSGEWKKAKAWYQTSLKLALKIGHKRIISEVLNDFGNLYQNIGEWNKSLAYYKFSLVFAEEIGNKKSIFYSLNSLGDLFRDRGNWNIALDYYQRGLNEAKELKYKKGISIAYNNLGHVYQNKGEWKEAEGYLIESLKISQEIDYKERTAIVLNSIGYLYKQMGQWEESIKNYTQSIDLSKYLGFRKEILKSYNNLGDIYRRKGELKDALSYLQKSCKLAEELNDKKSIACSYHYLGLYYKICGSWKEAYEYYEKSLYIFDKLGYEKGKAESYRKLANICRGRGEWDLAFEKYNKCIEISRNLNYELGKAKCHHNIAKLYAQKGSWDEALKNYMISIEFSEKLGYEAGTARCYRGIANIYREKGQWENALEYYKDSLEIFRELGDSQGILITKNEFSELYLKYGNWDEAEKMLNEACKDNKSISSIPILEALIVKNKGYLLSLRKNYKEAISVLESSNEKMEKIGAKPEKINILEKCGDVCLEGYREKKEEEFLVKAEIYYTSAKNISNELCMPFQKAKALRGLAIVEFLKLDKKSESKFLESINLFRELDASFELQKTKLEYAKKLYESNSCFMAETVTKSVVFDAQESKNHELLAKSYILLGDISDKEQYKYKYYLKSLDTAKYNKKIYIRISYALIFRMQRMKHDAISNFILPLEKQNNEKYFGLFLKALSNKIYNKNYNDYLDPLPESLKTEFHNFTNI